MSSIRVPDRRLEPPLSWLRDLLGDPEARQRLLPPLTGKQTAALEERLPAVYHAARSFTDRFPCANGEIVFPASIFKIVQMPSLSADDLATAVQWETWVFALDDLFDQRQRDFKEICDIVDECYRVAIVPPGTEDISTDFGASFREIKLRLAAHQVFRELQPAFAGTLARLVDAMAYEYAFRPGRAPARRAGVPSLDEYLYHASHIFAHTCMWILPLHDDESVLPALGPLTRLADQCSRALRLANDLSTFRREEHEGVLNGVVVAMGRSSPPANPSDQRRRQALVKLAARLQRERRNAARMVSTMSTVSGVELSFVRGMELAIRMFEHYEARDWASQARGLERVDVP